MYSMQNVSVFRPFWRWLNLQLFQKYALQNQTYYFLYISHSSQIVEMETNHQMLKYPGNLPLLIVQ